MDSLTQMVLGAAVGEAVLGKKIGNRAILWGAVAGTLPDLDVLANGFMSPIDALAFHRGITHSAVVCLLAALGMGWLIPRLYTNSRHKWVAVSAWVLFGLIISLSLFFAGNISLVKSIISIGILLIFFYFIHKRYSSPNYHTRLTASTRDWQRMFWWALITHPILDCFTTYGTQILLPFTDKRVSFDNISVADPLYTIPLLVFLLLAMNKSAGTGIRSKLNWLGLGISSVYMMLTILNKQYVNSVFTASLESQNIQYERYMTTPTILNNVLWSGIAETDTSFFMGQYSLFDSQKKFVLQEVPKNHTDIQAYLTSDYTLKKLAWFSNGYFTVQAEQPDQLIWYDLRFGSFRLSPEGKDEFVFRFDLNKNDNQFIMQKQPTRPRDGDPNAMMNALWTRVKGI